MKLILPLALLALAAPQAIAAPPRKAAAAQNDDAAFKSLSQRFLASAMRLSPVEATGMGVHRYDSVLPDVTATGRAGIEAEQQKRSIRLGLNTPMRIKAGIKSARH